MQNAKMRCLPLNFCRKICNRIAILLSRYKVYFLFANMSEWNRFGELVYERDDYFSIFERYPARLTATIKYRDVRVSRWSESSRARSSLISALLFSPVIDARDLRNRGLPRWLHHPRFRALRDSREKEIGRIFIFFREISRNSEHLSFYRARLCPVGGKSNRKKRRKEKKRRGRRSANSPQSLLPLSPR